MPEQSNSPTASETVYLIDASIYIFRAWFGIPDHFFDDHQRPVNAVFGYLAVLLRFLAHARPEKVVAAFDESLFTGFRHQLYPGYKASRALPDEALAYQLQMCKTLTEWLGIGTVASPTYEADDLIATIARKRRLLGEKVVVLSTDKDLAQIVGPGDWLWDFHGDRWLDQQTLQEHWGFPVSRIADYLALVGDAVDDIPGVPGVGAKTGRQLLAHYNGLDELYANLDQMGDLSLRGARRLKQRLLEHEQEARLFYKLTLLRDTAKCRWGDKTVKLGFPDKRQLYAWWRASGLTRALRLDQYLADYE